MESYYNLNEIKKEEHPYFLFYLNLLSKEKSKNYINSIFGVPKLPLIGAKGENNGNSHLLGKILSLVSFQINICQGKGRDEIDQVFSDFELPQNINEYLNIEEVIEIDNNTDEPGIHLYFMPKRKLNFYFIITELPIYPVKKNEKINLINKNIIINDDNINFFEEDKNNKKENKNNIKINSNDVKNNNINCINNLNNINKINEEENYNINKINAIEEETDINKKMNIINNDKNNNKFIFIEDNKITDKKVIRNKFDILEGDDYYDYENEEEEDKNIDYNKFEIYSIIPHFFYINDNEKSLLEVKNLVFDKQITLFGLPYRNYYDIERENDKKFIDINNLRAESSNIILINKNNFVIEKDNLKFYLDVSKDLSQFYLIYTCDDDEYHSVFYYITCNNIEAKNKMKNILNKEMKLKDVINEIEKNFGKNDVNENLKKIFFNKINK